MIKKISITIIVIALVIIGAYAYWKWQTSQAEPLPTLTTTEYFLYTTEDLGQEITEVGQGDVVIVQIPKAQYGEPIIIEDAKGRSVEFTREAVNDDADIALSFYIRTLESINVRATSLIPLKKDFTITVIPKKE